MEVGVKPALSRPAVMPSLLGAPSTDHGDDGDSRGDVTRPAGAATAEVPMRLHNALRFLTRVQPSRLLLPRSSPSHPPAGRSPPSLPSSRATCRPTNCSELCSQHSATEEHFTWSLTHPVPAFFSPQRARPADPDPAVMSPDLVGQFYSAIHADLTNAVVEGGAFEGNHPDLRIPAGPGHQGLNR